MEPAPTSPAPDERDPLLRLVKRLAEAATAYHRAALEFEEPIPSGPVVLVGNHGLFGLETPVFFNLLYRATGRFPIGLADRNVFGFSPMRQILARVGGIVGTRKNARALLEQGHLVVCYPGGSREVFKSGADRYRLRWDRTMGFAQLATELQVPVLPFAGLGVDDSFIHLGHPPLSRRLLGRYAVPLAMGLGPLPLPVRLRFRLARLLTPPFRAGDEGALKRAAEEQVVRMLREGGMVDQGAATILS